MVFCHFKMSPNNSIFTINVTIVMPIQRADVSPGLSQSQVGFVGNEVLKSGITLLILNPLKYVKKHTTCFNTECSTW